MVSVTADRPKLVFVHGWAQSAQAWHAQVEALSARFEVATVDLPGHGGAADAPGEAWEETLLSSVGGEPAVLVGWSLGGMLAMRLAMRRPDWLQGLILVGSTPCFRIREGWPHGCEDAVFERFRESLESNAPRLLDRFFALMLQGDALDRRRYVDIARHAVDKRRPPSMGGMRTGLALLDTLDLREELTRIRIPTLIVHGEQDAISPVGAARHMAAHIPGAVLKVLPGGHAPHLARPEEFDSIVEEWCLNNISIPAR